MALELTRLLTEMSTGNHPGGKGQPVHKVDNLITICELFRKCGSLDVSGIITNCINGREKALVANSDKKKVCLMMT
jgi:hypothetical protein